MFHWEQVGGYCCTNCVAIAPFWSSTKHLICNNALLAHNWQYIPLIDVSGNNILDTFCSFTRNFTFVTCFLFAKEGQCCPCSNENLYDNHIIACECFNSIIHCGFTIISILMNLKQLINLLLLLCQDLKWSVVDHHNNFFSFYLLQYYFVLKFCFKCINTSKNISIRKRNKIHVHVHVL